MVDVKGMANSIIKNTVANVAAKIWAFLSLYLFVPIWIHFLGVEGYGVISFYTVLMSLMLFADAGLTATLTREFARGDVDDQYRRDLLRTIEIIYIGIALILFITLFLLSDVLVNNFLKSSMYSHSELRFCVRLMALTMSLQFMFSMYCGGLFGLQKQVIANVIVVSHSIARSALVVLPLLVSNTIQTFFIWQLISIIVALIVVRNCLVKSISATDGTFNYRPEYLKLVWKFALGMMLMGFISALNTQLDKLVTGNVLSLENLGYYSLASTIGFAVISITQPIGVAVYPELTRLSSNNKDKMGDLLLVFTYIITTLSVAIGMTLFFYIEEFTFLWTRDSEIVSMTKTPARLLIIGNILQTLQLAPYYLALANGHTKTNVRLGLLMLLFMVPSVYYFTKEWGLEGTAIPFLILNIVATIYLTLIIFRKFFSNRIKEWLGFVIKPLMINMFIISSFYFLLQLLNLFDSRLVVFIYGVGVCLTSLYISIRFLIKINPGLLEFIPEKIIMIFTNKK